MKVGYLDKKLDILYKKIKIHRIKDRTAYTKIK